MKKEFRSIEEDIGVNYSLNNESYLNEMAEDIEDYAGDDEEGTVSKLYFKYNVE